MSSFLPPTSNLLGQEQRTRLIKSTRKLEAVLGTTPRLLDPSDCARSSFDSSDIPSSRSSSRASHRSARIYGAWGSNSSVLSFASSSSSSSSDSDYDNDSDMTSPEPSPAPRLEMCADLRPPFSPSETMSGGSNGNKKKVFEPTLFLRLNNLPHPCLNISRQSSDALATAVPVPPVVTPASPRSPVTPTTPRVTIDLQRRRKMAKLTRTLGENVPPELVFGKLRPSSIIGRPRSSSVDERTMINSSTSSNGDRTPPRRGPSKVYNTVHVTVPSNVSKYYDDSYGYAHDDRAGSLQRGVSTRVKGKGWSGEWNHEMDDVMNKLRNLK